MPRLLQIDASADTRTSVSRAVTATFAAAWRERGEGYEVVHRDLHADPVPHLPDAALHWAPRLRLPDDEVAVAAQQTQDALIAELVAADVLLIGAPMYNWSLPSTLKAWVDHIHVLGVTAPFDKPLTQPLAGRPAVIVVSSGAAYGPGTPTEGWDHATPALQLLLGQALGMVVSVLTVELTLAGRIPAMAPLRERADAGLAAAHAQATQLAHSF
jgi:FMN-dependent NADH-azoreductase